jgi:hypothetical protein
LSSPNSSRFATSQHFPGRQAPGRTGTARWWCPEHLHAERKPSGSPTKWRKARSTRRLAAIFCGAAAASLALPVARATKSAGDGYTNDTYFFALFSQAFGTHVDLKERSWRAPERSDLRESPGHRDIVCIRARVRRQSGLRKNGEKGNYFSTCFVGSSPRRCGGTKAVLAVCSPSRMRTS